MNITWLHFPMTEHQHWVASTFSDTVLPCTIIHFHACIPKIYDVSYTRIYFLSSPSYLYFVSFYFSPHNLRFNMRTRKQTHTHTNRYTQSHSRNYLLQPKIFDLYSQNSYALLMHFFVFSPLPRARDVFLFNLLTNFSVPITCIAANTPRSFSLEVLFASKYSSPLFSQLSTRHNGCTFKPSSSPLLPFQEDIGVSPCQNVFFCSSVFQVLVFFLTLFIPQ
jgi:hypothetical protein